MGLFTRLFYRAYSQTDIASDTDSQDCQTIFFTGRGLFMAALSTVKCLLIQQILAVMKLQYDLERIEGLVTRDIPNFIELHFQVSVELVDNFKVAIDEESEKIKHKFSKALVLYSTEQSVRRYFTCHQHSLIMLSADLARYANHHKSGLSSLDYTVLCQYLLTALQQLLLFTTYQYTRFTDFNIWLPAGYRHIAAMRARKDMKDLSTRMLAFNIDPKLVEVTLLPFKQLLSGNTSDEITYGKVYFLTELHREIHTLLSSKEALDKSNSLELCLLYLNYNSRSYFEYVIQKIYRYVKESESIPEQLEQLAFFQKTIHQVQVKPLIAYDHSFKSLQELLLDWIDQEILFLEMKLQTITRLNNKDKTIMPAESQTDFKIKTELSVSQLAYLLKVFIEVNIIQSKSVAALLRIIPKLFKTKRAESLGFSSLESKYYKPETSTKKTVRDLLLRMVKHIEKSEPLNLL